MLAITKQLDDAQITVNNHKFCRAWALHPFLETSLAQRQNQLAFFVKGPVHYCVCSWIDSPDAQQVMGSLLSLAAAPLVACDCSRQSQQAALHPA